MSYREDPIWSIRNLRLFQDLSHEDSASCHRS
jgi:hypothetical protein